MSSSSQPSNSSPTTTTTHLDEEEQKETEESISADSAVTDDRSNNNNNNNNDETNNNTDDNNNVTTTQPNANNTPTTPSVTNIPLWRRIFRTGLPSPNSQSPPVSPSSNNNNNNNNNNNSNSNNATNSTENNENEIVEEEEKTAAGESNEEFSETTNNNNNNNNDNSENDTLNDKIPNELIIAEVVQNDELQEEEGEDDNLSVKSASALLMEQSTKLHNDSNSLEDGESRSSSSLDKQRSSSTSTTTTRSGSLLQKIGRSSSDIQTNNNNGNNNNTTPAPSRTRSIFQLFKRNNSVSSPASPPPPSSPTGDSDSSAITPSDDSIASSSSSSVSSTAIVAAPVVNNAPMIEQDGDDESIIIGSRNLAQLKQILLTDSKFGYLTVDQFIEFGIRYGFNHISFIVIFTTTYKTFMNPKHVIPRLRAVLDRVTSKDEKTNLEKERQNRIVQRTARFIKNWISNCQIDFMFDKQIIEDLYSLIGSVGTYACTIEDDSTWSDSDSSYDVTQNSVFSLAEFSSKLLSDLRNRTENVMDTNDTHILSMKEMQEKMKKWPKPYLLSRQPTDPRMVNILDLNPLEIARQLTLAEFSMFEKVTGEELLGLGWNKDTKEWTAPNITEIISRSNTMTDWVATMILRVENNKDRCRMLKHFVLVADACLRLYNFNTLFEIVMALISNPVYRLKQTWEGIGSEKQKFKKLEEVCAFAGNRKNYREELKKVPSTQSCLPYIGVSLTDLVFFEEGNKSSKTTTEKEANTSASAQSSSPRLLDETGESDEVKSYINFTKRSLMAGVVSSLMDFKSRPYQLRPVEYMQQFLYYSMNADVINSEEELDRLSRLREPPRRQS